MQEENKTGAVFKKQENLWRGRISTGIISNKKVNN